MDASTMAILEAMGQHLRFVARRKERKHCMLLIHEDLCFNRDEARELVSRLRSGTGSSNIVKENHGATAFA